MLIDCPLTTITGSRTRECGKISVAKLKSIRRGGELIIDNVFGAERRLASFRDCGMEVIVLRSELGLPF